MRHLRRLFPSADAWVAPFVVQLLGEYVLEIVQLLAAHLDDLKAEPYKQFIVENPGFLSLTKQRMISYWDCYYRRQYPRPADKPGR